MSVKRYNILLLSLLLSTAIMHSQEIHTDFHFYFRSESTVLDSTYMNNADQMQQMKHFMQYLHQAVAVDSTLELQSIVVRGESSPDGSEQLNHRLALGRAKEVEKMVKRTLDVPEHLITRVDRYIDWKYLRQQVAASDMPQKEEVLRVLSEDTAWVKYHLRGERIDQRVVQLQQIDNGKAWRQLIHEFFPPMCNGGVLFVTNKVVPNQIVTKEGTVELSPVAPKSPVIAEPLMEEPIAEEPIAEEPLPAEPTIVEPTQDTVATIEQTPVAETPVEPAPIDTLPQAEWQHHITLKTNAIGWAFAVANIAFEADLAQHWSLNLPFYWSSWDYFKTTIKLRTCILQPEIRYWFNENNEQWFLGAHFGVAWYNIAWNGNYRIQDQGWDKPGLGGGIAAGYRMPLSKKHPKWKVEFSLGLGVYSMYYDKFYNGTDGLLTEQGHKAFFCIDHAAVSFSYSFDTKQKGGKP